MCVRGGENGVAIITRGEGGRVFLVDVTRGKGENWNLKGMGIIIGTSTVKSISIISPSRRQISGESSIVNIKV